MSLCIRPHIPVVDGQVRHLQELLKQEDMHRRMAGGLAAGQKHAMPTVGAAAAGPAAVGEHDDSVVGKTAIETAGDEKEDDDVEEEL